MNQRIRCSWLRFALLTSIVAVAAVVALAPIVRSVGQARLRRAAIRSDSPVLGLLPSYPGAKQVFRLTQPGRSCEECQPSSYGLVVGFDLPTGTQPDKVLGFYREHRPSGWRLARDSDCPQGSAPNAPKSGTSSSPTAPVMVSVASRSRVASGRGSEWLVF